MTTPAAITLRSVCRVMLPDVVTAVGGVIRRAEGYISRISGSLPFDLDLNMSWLRTVKLLGAGLFATSTSLVAAQSDCPDYATYSAVCSLCPWFFRT